MAYSYCPRCAAELAQSEMDGVVRVHCPQPECSFVHYENPTPVVAAIVQRGEDVILVRSHGWPEKWFGLVTGFLEKSEDPAEGVLREVLEELGLEGTLGQLVGVYPFKRMNQVIIAYHVAVTGDVTLGDELADYKLVPITKLKPWPMGTGKAVSDWLENRQVLIAQSRDRL